MVNAFPIGIGFYTIPEAARLLKIPALSIRRWLGGYDYQYRGKVHRMDPLWNPQLPRDENHILLGFRDLIELRFVNAFIQAGLNLFTIRNCLELAKRCVEDDHPFSTRRFRTDGKTIFLESVQQSGDTQLLDLKNKQYAIKRIIERSFKDLDIEKDAVARWRPFKGKSSIIVDPERAFGQPVAARYGIPTVALAQAASAEGSVKAVARLYEIPVALVRDAVAFEKFLMAA